MKNGLLFCTIKRHKLLVILKLSSCAKVCQLIHNAAVIFDEFHYISRFQVPIQANMSQESGTIKNKLPVNEIIITQMIHSSRQVA